MNPGRQGGETSGRQLVGGKEGQGDLACEVSVIWTEAGGGLKKEAGVVFVFYFWVFFIDSHD